MKEVKNIGYVAFVMVTITMMYGTEFPVCDKMGHQNNPDIAFIGAEYYVVYDSVGDIWGARISLNGTVLERFLINGDQYKDTLPTIATDGQDWFVVWLDLTARDVWGAIGRGSMIYHPKFHILGGADEHPNIAYNGSVFLVVGTCPLLSNPQRSYLYGAICDINGNLLTSEFIIDIAGGQYEDEDGYLGYPACTSDGNRFIVIYPYCQASFQIPQYTTHQIRFKFVEADGSVPSFIGAVDTKTTSGYTVPAYNNSLILYRTPPAITFNATNYFCSYHLLENYGILPNEGSYDCYGALIDQNGNVITNNIPIATKQNIQEHSTATIAEDDFFYIVWQDSRSGSTYDLYGRHCNPVGVLRGSEVSVSLAANNQSKPQIAFDGHNSLITWTDYRNSNWDIYANLFPKWLTTTDGSALAYNGNRHLTRKPNSNEFHMVYTDRGKVVHRYSRNDSLDQATLDLVGDGKWPSIVLDANGWPYIAWTDNAGGLWFRYQTAAGWSSTYHLFTPSGSNPIINSPPSIALVVNRGVIYPHILVTRNGPSGNVAHRVDDFTFAITNPGAGSFELLEQRTNLPASPLLRLNPSLVKDDFDSLHAVWQRTDTIAYATRYRVSSWVVWGPVLLTDGLQSAYPFMETYGNKAFIAWQKGSPEDVFLGYRTLSYTSWTKPNQSNTPTTRSIYGVSASGWTTVYADELSSPWDIYSTVFGDISQSSGITSLYNHAAAKLGTTNYLYVLWLEDNSSPYEIKFKNMAYIPNPEQIYLSSTYGQSTASPYLVSRDGFKDTWQVPVDYGNTSLTYRFPLLPEFKYKIKVTAYHQGTGDWQEKVKIDGLIECPINYSANTPKTVEALIPEYLYQDSVVEIVINKVSGSFATAGPIEIYRYEYEEGENGGPQSTGTARLYGSNLMLNIYPNPAHKEFSIKYALPKDTKVSLSLYDASGRLVSMLVNGIQEAGSYCKTLHTMNLSQGIYFIKLSTSSHTETSKVIFLK